MEHLVEDHGVGRARRRAAAHTCRPGAARPRRDPAWASLTRASRSISGERSTPSDRLARRAEQLDHPSGAGADVDQPAERRGRRAPGRSPPRPRSRRRAASAARPIPRHGRRNSARRRRRGRRAPRRAGRRRRPCRRLAVELAPAVEQLEQGLEPGAPAEADEHPAAFLAPLGEAGVDQDLDVAGDARLALPEHLRELADRQLHRPQQHQDPQPRRIGQRGENLGQPQPYLRI